MNRWGFISNFRFQISDFRFQISNFRFQISNFKFQISNFRFQIIAHRLRGWTQISFFLLLAQLTRMGTSPPWEGLGEASSVRRALPHAERHKAVGLGLSLSPFLLSPFLLFPFTFLLFPFHLCACGNDFSHRRNFIFVRMEFYFRTDGNPIHSSRTLSFAKVGCTRRTYGEKRPE